MGKCKTSVSMCFVSCSSKSVGYKEWGVATCDLWPVSQKHGDNLRPLKNRAIYFSFVCIHCLHICICTTYMSDACRGHQSMSDPLELELAM